jgi:Ni/Fe-hydrogenase subunit HybB-like protein
LFGYQGKVGWELVPSVPELMVTIGLVSLHILAFILFCKLLPVLSNPPRAAAEGHAT